MNKNFICTLLISSVFLLVACGVAPGDRENEGQRATGAVSALSMCAPGNSIALLSRANGNYVTADLGYASTPLRAEVNHMLGWEEYTIVDAGGDWVALRSNANGLYVSADLNAGGALESGWATTIADREKFQFVPADDGWYGIRTHANGLYASANLNQSGAPLQAAWATTIQSWEEYQCVPFGGDTPGSITEDQVEYDLYRGGGDIDQWILHACTAIGIPYNDYWKSGYETLCQRESSWGPNEINTSDGNAFGPIVDDGYPQNCSRGVAQTIPPTFAMYHAAGTSLEIYDPVANIAASMNYVMAMYGVSPDGSNLAANVQQADPNRPPHGY